VAAAAGTVLATAPTVAAVLAVRSAAVLVTAGTAPPVAIGCATATAAWTV
jgi:hypothetical protein